MKTTPSIQVDNLYITWGECDIIREIGQTEHKSTYKLKQIPMGNSRKRVELSPRLQFGVNKGRSNSKFLKLTGIVFLLIAGVLSFNAASVIFSNHGDNTAPQGQVAGVSDTPQATAETQPVDFISYTVQKGDTLFAVSQKFNVSWTTLMTINHKETTAIKPGEVLKIPKQ